MHGRQRVWQPHWLSFWFGWIASTLISIVLIRVS